MVRRIDKADLRVGMFVEAVEGQWRDNPNVGRRFLLKTQEDVERLKSSTVSAVYINNTKGKTGGKDAGFRAASSPISEELKRETVKVVKQSVDTIKDVFSSQASGTDGSVKSLSPVIQSIRSSLEQDPSVLISMTRLRSFDNSTYMHSLSVGALMVNFAQFMEMDEETIQSLGVAGILHDIGKLAICPDILKKNGQLTPEERSAMEQHTTAGFDLLSSWTKTPEIVLDICRHHHERVDGKGYPDALKSDDISIYTKMATICDVYDAITSARSYKQAWSSAEALSWMMARQGHFDGGLLWKFILSLDSRLTKGVI